MPESLPEVPGYETGLLYAPAANEPTGGDVYGAWPVGGTRWPCWWATWPARASRPRLSAMVRFFVEARSWDTLSREGARAGERHAARPAPARHVRDGVPRDPLARLARYCNAGHLPPLHVRSGSVCPLDSHGLPLGVLERHGYSESELRLEPGDLVFAHTDGLVEARQAGAMYGTERLAELVASLAELAPPQELVRAVHEDVTAWAEDLGRRRGARPATHACA